MSILSTINTGGYMKKPIEINSTIRLKEFGFELSDLLNISPEAGYKRARRACLTGQVECKQINKTWLVNRYSVNAYLKYKKDE